MDGDGSPGGELVVLGAQHLHPNRPLVDAILDRITFDHGGTLSAMERERVYALLAAAWQIGSARREDLTVRRIARCTEWAGSRCLTAASEIFDQSEPGSFERLQNCMEARVQPERLLPVVLLCLLMILKPQDVSRFVAAVEVFDLRP